MGNALGFNVKHYARPSGMLASSLSSGSGPLWIFAEGVGSRKSERKSVRLRG